MLPDKNSHSDCVLLNEHCCRREFMELFDRSETTVATRIFFTKIEPDFNVGKFKIFVKYNYEKEVSFQLYKPKNINDIWVLMERVIESDDAVLLPMFFCGEETIIYLEPKGKDMRFVVTNSKELKIKRANNEIYDYSYADFEVILDILVKKKEFISRFYSIMKRTFELHQDACLFESYIIDFSYWTKSSKKIEDYLNSKDR